MDNAEATDNFIDDLECSIRYREGVLKEFEQAVSKIIDVQKEPEAVSLTAQPKNKIKPIPVFKEGIASGFLAL